MLCVLACADYLSRDECTLPRVLIVVSSETWKNNRDPGWEDTDFS